MTDPSKPLSEHDFQAWASSLEPPERTADAQALDAVFRDATGFAPQLWSGGIIGYGRYDYRYKTGRSGTYLATGFAPRKAKISIYIMPGYANFDPILNRLGKHKSGQACVYVNKLADIDLAVLSELIQAGLENLATHWPVTST